MGNHWKSRDSRKPIYTDFSNYLSERVKIVGDCLVWDRGTTRGGYGVVGSIHFRRMCGYTITAHRISYMMHHGIVLSPEQHVMHSCDNRLCVNINHLSVGTNAENVADKMAKGRHRAISGEGHCRAKLTREKVGFIIRTKGVFSGALIAEVFEMDRSTINDVRRGKNWKSVTQLQIK